MPNARIDAGVNLVPNAGATDPAKPCSKDRAK
jgi:hypothetical protein